MSGQNQFYDMQNTLTRLLDLQSKQGSDQSSLIMLSLVNLMGIIDILNKRMHNTSSIRDSSSSPVDLASLQHMVAPLLNILTNQGQSDRKTQQPNRSINQTEQGSDTDDDSGQNSGFESGNSKANKQNGGQYAKPKAVANPLAGLLNLLGGGGSQPNLAPLLALLGGVGGNQFGLNSLISMLSNQSNQKVDLGALMNVLGGLAGTSQAGEQNKDNNSVRTENASAGESQSEESYQEDKNRIIVKKGR